jgi:tetratricopeptide (TPR) repeat protein
MFMTQHPTEETLAEYVDNLLLPAPRLEVTQHLVECGECREIVMMASDFQSSETDNVKRSPRWLVPVAAVAALAVAASIAMFVLQPAWFFPPKMDDVDTAARELTIRMSDGQRSGQSPYRKQGPQFRGTSDPQSSAAGAQLQLVNVAIKAEGRKPHVYAMALLLAAEKPQDLSEPITLLRELWEHAKPGERDAIGIDYAYALLTRKTESDAVEALQVSDDLLKRERLPKALWNRAAALELLGRDAEAIAAWDEYLKVDPGSEWASEAKTRRSKLAEP